MVYENKEMKVCEYVYESDWQCAYDVQWENDDQMTYVWSLWVKPLNEM